MLVDVTNFYHREDPALYSASASELGQDADSITWEAAMRAATVYHHLNHSETLDEFRRFVRSSGGWGDDEVAAMDDATLNALFIQWVAGDMREAHLYGTPDDDWTAYETDAMAGRVAGRLARQDGRVYFDIGG